jgi:hypothetical protein
MAAALSGTMNYCIKNSYSMARTSHSRWNDDDVRYVLDQHA